jgi:hypothetical protein
VPVNVVGNSGSHVPPWGSRLPQERHTWHVSQHSKSDIMATIKYKESHDHGEEFLLIA